MMEWFDIAIVLHADSLKPLITNNNIKLVVAEPWKYDA